MSNEQAKVYEIVEMAVDTAMSDLGSSWMELSFCNGAEVFESDSNTHSYQAVDEKDKAA